MSRCLECNCELDGANADEILCPLCDGKIDNDLRILHEDELAPEEFFQII